MLAFVFNFGTLEILCVAVVAVLVFGRKLPEVAVQAAQVVQKLRRAMTDLRRETGIDEELRRARRTIDEAVPRDLRRMDVRDVVRRQAEQAFAEEDPTKGPEARVEPKPAEPEPESAAEDSADEEPPVTR